MHAADDKTTTDLHAAQDKDGSSGSAALEPAGSRVTSILARQTLGCLSASQSYEENHTNTRCASVFGRLESGEAFG
jgi:hypothetical protein